WGRSGTFRRLPKRTITTALRGVDVPSSAGRIEIRLGTPAVRASTPGRARMLGPRLRLPEVGLMVGRWARWWTRWTAIRAFKLGLRIGRGLAERRLRRERA